MTLVLTILLFLAILSILVLAHEWGHYKAARIFGVHVDEFGIGFPPRITGIKKGPTLFTLNWLPLGGFVKLKGEQGDDKNDKDSFSHIAIWKRLVILFAGVTMNMIFAVAIFWLGFSIGMPSQIDGYDGKGTITNEKIQITQLLKDGNAQKSGVEAGDEILSIDDNTFTDVGSLIKYIETDEDKMLTMALIRGEENKTIEVPVGTITSEGKEKPGIGVNIAHTATVRYPIHRALLKALEVTAVMTLTIIALLWNAVTSLAFDGFVGPVGIAAYTGTVMKVGFSSVLILMAQLSISLAILNILPVPALDGGRALFQVIEKLRGKAMAKQSEGIMQLIGFGLLILLVILVTIRDIGNLF